MQQLIINELVAFCMRFKRNSRKRSEKMKLSEEIEKLQEKNEGKIILIKSGIFFIAIGKDAVVLHDVLGLKTTCMKDRICKVGFPVRNVEKYIRLLNENDLSFIIYVKNEERKIEELYKNDGKDVNEFRTCLDCKECLNFPETEKDILERIRKIGK